MNQSILDKIRKVEPYVPGEQPKERVIKLNTNENPYPPAPGVAKVLKEMDADSLRLYPDPAADILVEELSRFYRVGKEQIFVGVGSDDVLSMCFLTFFNSDKPILFPDITYSFYKVWAQLYRIPYRCPKLDEQFCLVKEDYYAENGGIIFPNPNAPTAIYEDLDFIEDILRQNLLVVQTFSKSRSMAGMRIGFAIGNPELIGYLNDAKYSFNSYTMNQAALLCGAQSVKEETYFYECVDRIVETREWAKQELAELGFTYTDSRANFLFVTHPEFEASELFEALKREKIYVRYWNSERIRQYLRITVGTRQEMESLLEFLKKYSKERGKGKKEC